jgi:chaperonin GroES
MLSPWSFFLPLPIATITPSKGFSAAASGMIRPLAENDHGDNIALEVKVSDKVLFTQFAGSEIKVDGETLLVMT